MSNIDLETRVANLEAIVAELLQEKEKNKKNEIPWWEQIRGTFANDPDYDEAMRLGREYRESLRPKDESEENPNDNS